MKSKDIYKQIIEAIRVATKNCSTEPQIVREAISEIEKINLPSSVKIQTGFCHQKPYAIFVTPDNLYGFNRTELGDLMFVVKVVCNNIVIDYRSLFFQAKYDANFGRFKIEKHQQRFYSQISKIEFRFGNKVYSQGNVKPIAWRNISCPEDFGDYLLIGNGSVLDVSLKEINKQYDPSQRHFFFDLIQQTHVLPCQKRFLLNLDNPLLNFLAPYGKGNKIEGMFEIFTELIYKKLGMIVDPPEEHEGFWEDDKMGFGVVEVTYFEE